MSRPEDIPVDVWDHVERAVVPMSILGSEVGNSTVANCCRAIMAAKAEEREACAQILDERAQDFNRQRDPGMANSCRSHAAAIRKRGEA